MILALGFPPMHWLKCWRGVGKKGTMHCCRGSQPLGSKARPPGPYLGLTPRLTCKTFPPQVTAEVGQECLTLQERMRGGLLGAGHSWVASPLDSSAGPGGPAESSSHSALDAVPEDLPTDAACAVTVKAASATAASDAASAGQPGTSNGSTAGAPSGTEAGAAAKAADAATTGAIIPASAEGNGRSSTSGDSNEAAAAPPAAGLLRRFGRALSRRRFGAK